MMTNYQHIAPKFDATFASPFGKWSTVSASYCPQNSSIDSINNKSIDSLEAPPNLGGKM